jgi:hypothetical protein
MEIDGKSQRIGGVQVLLMTEFSVCKDYIQESQDSF